MSRRISPYCVSLRVKKLRGTCNTGSPARRAACSGTLDWTLPVWRSVARSRRQLDSTPVDATKTVASRTTNEHFVIVTSSLPFAFSIALLLVAITVTSNARTTLVRSTPVTQGHGNSENAVVTSFFCTRRGCLDVARLSLHYLIMFRHKIITLWYYFYLFLYEKSLLLFVL